MSQRQPKSGNSTARDPPPSLFLHPSTSASHVPQPGAPAGAGLASNMQQAQVPPPLSRSGSMLNPRGRTVPRLASGDSTRTADRTDVWAEMQATLEEAELSASGGTHVFGPDHEQKLTELRAAQIALAQAWARGEADDAAAETVTQDTEVRNFKGALGEMTAISAAVAAGAALGATISAGTARGTADGTDAGRSTVGTASARPGSGGVDGEHLGAKLEEETERDILLARTRREANDHYFSRVDQGVKDVVARLEEVANAMRAVEQETRGIWGEETSHEGTDA
ncbi:hypothetical protein F5Y17DRAFT_459772 [Xylariaceae sp. FL0594]|nr:hypothetical protein F5Y17DRAFT_459772 [Xylariaceae sp. FL0594]